MILRDQNSYAGFVDGEYWWTLVETFKDRAKKYHFDGPPHAVITAERMATTADDVPNDLVMAMFEILEGEYDDQFDRTGDCNPEETDTWKTFDAMCERFSSGYHPKDATEFVRDLVARLTGSGGDRHG